MSERESEAAPTDIRVLTAGTSDVFIAFGSEGDRRVELLNAADARQLYELLGEVVADE